MQQDVDIFEDGFLRIGVGHEVGRDIALVELHTFDHAQLVFHSFAFFDFDNTLFADLIDCISQDFADLWVVVCADSCYFCNIAVAFHVDTGRLDEFSYDLSCFIYSTLDGHRVYPRGYMFQALEIDCLSQNR